MSGDAPRIAAIIGHADEPAMLEQCIRHHLASGVGYVFVSLNRDADELPQSFAGDPRVKAAHASDFAQDPFLYFSDAVRLVVEWAAPDWILFADTDEFWLPERGDIAQTRDLESIDLVIVERFNTPVMRLADGTLAPPDLGDPSHVPLLTRREPIDDAYLAGDTQTPWIMGLDAPKVMVRPALVSQVGTGGHSIVAHDPRLRWRMACDLLIVHAPFTTEARFRAKISAVRDVLGGHADRFNSRQAWHWRFWLSLDDSQVAAEFRRQSIRESALPALRRQGVASMPAEQYARMRDHAEPLEGDALHEALGRVILNYQRPGAASPASSSPASSSTASSVQARQSARALEHATPRHVANADDCFFWHSMTIPGHGEVRGQWDLRGAERAFLGGIELRDRTVLEIGAASGYLGFWMEHQGADVTAFDLDENEEWDIVPFAGQDGRAIVAARQAAIRQINNSWWFTHERLNSRARAIYGNVYDLDRLDAMFDVVTLTSVLLHLRDPLRALGNAAARCARQIVVTELSQHQFLGPDSPMLDKPSMQLIPKLASRSPVDAWWLVPETLTVEYLGILGFRSVEITHHTQNSSPDQQWRFYSAVGTR